MEKRTDFDLNERILNWRESLGDRAGINESDIDELESHLRETIDALLKAELSQEEAFLIATRRIGRPWELEDQYAAVNGTAVWRTRLSWMIAGVLGYWALLGVSGTLSKLTFLSTAGQQINGLMIGFLGVAIHVALLVTVGWLVVRHCGRPPIGGAGKLRSRMAIGSVQMVVCLAAVCLVTSAVNVWLNTFVARLQNPTSLGGYYLVIGYYVGPLSYLLVVAFGIWLARPCRVKYRNVGALTVGPLMLLLAACSPGSGSGSTTAASASTNSQPATTSIGEQTPFEQCLALVASDLNAAVDSFMTLNLTSEALFTYGTPLSYSEAEFVKLPRPVIEKVSEPKMKDIEALRQLIKAVGTRRDQARMNKDSETADHYSKQLAALGTRLTGGENLLITQIVGRLASKIAAQ